MSKLRASKEKEKERPVVYSSEESGFHSMPPNGGQVIEEEPLPALPPLQLKSKDLARYKRDYYVPSGTKNMDMDMERVEVEEAVNCQQEKVTLNALENNLARSELEN